MDFPMLYKLNNKNKITQWNIEVVSVKKAYDIITTFGELNGKMRTHKKTITKGKANRSVHEQALLEARSKWNEKTNQEAYGTSTNFEDIQKVVRPMLANTFDKTKYARNAKKTTAYKIPFPCFVQRKYDGIRSLSHMKDETVVMESRKGLLFSNFDNIKEELEILFGYMTNLYFDGELYTDLLPFENINGATRITEGKATKKDLENINKIEYHIYDVYSPDAPEMTFEKRMEILNCLDLMLNATDCIKIVRTDKADNIKDIKRLHDLYVQEGFEGVMVRDPIGTYEIDKRSKYLQKYKEFMEEEFVIVGYHDGEGLDKGLIIWDLETAEGKTFSAKPKGTHEYRRELFDNAEEYIGMKLTVIFQEYSTDGIPRFPVGKDLRFDI